MSSAILMAEDMQFFMVQGKVLQFTASICRNVFDLSDQVIKKNKSSDFSYHGAIQFGRNIVLF
jgi:hypothetical protein